MVNWLSVPPKKVTGAIVCRTSLWRPSFWIGPCVPLWATRRVAERDCDTASVARRAPRC